LAFTTGQARAGPEGETSFPYGVNKNSCFLLAPQQAEGFAMGPARAFSLAREARRQFRSKKVRISSNKRTKFNGASRRGRKFNPCTVHQKSNGASCRGYRFKSYTAYSYWG
ncbi:MAG: hypothetical protein CO159_04400, partial [Candidatus Portnoybacteria bacterium CG_4_9_14_3_um_filter_40_10]